MARQLSRFTPSLMSPSNLEDLYVPRSNVLDKIARRIAKAATTEGRNHTLLVGGRGAGKTHVISLAYHRAAAARQELGVQLAWLDEDPWLILSYDDLLAHIVERLEPKPEGEIGDDVAYYLQQRAAKGGPIVVFAENFDQILDQIGSQGQQELRYLLQTHRCLLLVASTTNLMHQALQEQSAPFYGFMTEERLIPFQRPQAAAMLTNISTLNGDEELAVYLKTPEAHARLAVVEHLAGGAPRMWATLGTALDTDGLDDLVDHLMATFDDLTPYYQEQLARLSGHQRRVVAALGKVDRPMSTVDLAKHLSIDQRSLSKTIHELKERGWVKACESPFISMLDGRSTYYELAEPLARIAFQIKANRGEPLSAVVDFLKSWFDHGQLDEAAGASEIALSYVTAALDELERDQELAGARQLVGARPRPDPHVLDTLLTCDRALAALQQGDAGPYFELSAAMRSALETTADASEQALQSARWLIHIHALLLANQNDRPEVVAESWLAQLHAPESQTPATSVDRVIRAGWVVLNREKPDFDANDLDETETAAFERPWLIAACAVASILFGTWALRITDAEGRFNTECEEIKPAQPEAPKEDRLQREENRTAALSRLEETLSTAITYFAGDDPNDRVGTQSRASMKSAFERTRDLLNQLSAEASS